MDIATVLIGLALAVIVVAYVAQPLMTKSRVALAPAQESPRTKLLAERDAVYATIRELDFDFQTGKLSEADYRSMRETHVARGVEILKRLDAMGAGRGRKSKVEGQSDEIEAAIRAHRRQASSQVCPACGRPIDPVDRFCAKCGAPLSAEAKR